MGAWPLVLLWSSTSGWFTGDLAKQGEETVLMRLVRVCPQEVTFELQPIQEGARHEEYGGQV